MRPKDPIEELHESRVFKRLKKICDDYAQRATRFVSEIAPVLATTSKFFPNYTRHDANHGYRVLRRIEQILKPGCFVSTNDEALSATELFLLIASAYAHDLGMTVPLQADYPTTNESIARPINSKRGVGPHTNPAKSTNLQAA